VDIAGHENWEPKTAGDIARAALDPPQWAVGEARADQREATIRHAAEFLRTLGRDDLAVALVRALS